MTTPLPIPIAIPRAGRKLVAAWDRLIDGRDAIRERQAELLALTNTRAIRGNANLLRFIHDEEEFLCELDGLLQAAYATARQAAPSTILNWPEPVPPVAVLPAPEPRRTWATLRGLVAVLGALVDGAQDPTEVPAC